MKKFCMDCNAKVQERKKRVEEARHRGYPSISNTPEYKRMQAEREWTARGKSIPPYLPKAARLLVAALARVDRGIASDCRKAYREWVKRFPKVSKAPTAEQREHCLESKRLAQRKRYRSNPDAVRQRVKVWKHANPEKHAGQGDRRAKLAAQQSDGTLTESAVKALYAAAKRCCYCQKPMRSKQKSLDHIIPLSLSGAHSVQNVVVCCRSCNASKHDRPVKEWLKEIGSDGIQTRLF
jgi:5-methylcytosine-specific restriction endonuclease McrA